MTKEQESPLISPFEYLNFLTEQATEWGDGFIDDDRKKITNHIQKIFNQEGEGSPEITEIIQLVAELEQDPQKNSLNRSLRHALLLGHLDYLQQQYPQPTEERVWQFLSNCPYQSASYDPLLFRITDTIMTLGTNYPKVICQITRYNIQKDNFRLLTNILDLALDRVDQKDQNELLSLAYDKVTSPSYPDKDWLKRNLIMDVLVQRGLFEKALQIADSMTEPGQQWVSYLSILKAGFDNPDSYKGSLEKLLDKCLDLEPQVEKAETDLTQLIKYIIYLKDPSQAQKKLASLSELEPPINQLTEKQIANIKEALQPQQTEKMIILINSIHSPYIYFDDEMVKKLVELLHTAQLNHLVRELGVPDEETLIQVYTEKGKADAKDLAKKMGLNLQKILSKHINY